MECTDLAGGFAGDQLQNPESLSILSINLLCSQAYHLGPLTLCQQIHDLAFSCHFPLSGQSSQAPSHCIGVQAIHQSVQSPKHLGGPPKRACSCLQQRVPAQAQAQHPRPAMLHQIFTTAQGQAHHHRSRAWHHMPALTAVKPQAPTMSAVRSL